MPVVSVPPKSTGIFSVSIWFKAAITLSLEFKSKPPGRTSCDPVLLAIKRFAWITISKPLVGYPLAEQEVLTIRIKQYAIFAVFQQTAVWGRIRPATGTQADTLIINKHFCRTKANRTPRVAQVFSPHADKRRISVQLVASVTAWEIPAVGIPLIVAI